VLGARVAASIGVRGVRIVLVRVLAISSSSICGGAENGEWRMAGEYPLPPFFRETSNQPAETRDMMPLPNRRQ